MRSGNTRTRPRQRKIIVAATAILTVILGVGITAASASFFTIKDTPPEVTQDGSGGVWIVDDGD